MALLSCFMLLFLNKSITITFTHFNRFILDSDFFKVYFQFIILLMELSKKQKYIALYFLSFSFSLKTAESFSSPEREVFLLNQLLFSGVTGGHC